MKCKVCDFESDSLEEVTYYNINGDPMCDSQEIERNASNPDALAHSLCTGCAEEFKF